MMFRYLLMAGTLLCVSGCGSIAGFLGDLLTLSDETGSSELKRFESRQELADYFTEQIVARNNRAAGSGFGFPVRGDDVALGVVSEDAAAGGSDDLGASPPPSGSIPQDGEALSGADDFSQTTIQEQGVDEPDVVKTDGTFLYIIDNNQVRIVRVTPPEALGVVGEFTVAGFGRDLFLYQDKVIALTTTGGGHFFGGGIAIGVLPFIDEDALFDVSFDARDSDLSNDLLFARPQTHVTIIDVSTPDSPTLVSTTAFEGSPSASRMIGGSLHLVLSNFQDFYIDVLPALGTRDLDLSGIDVEQLLPHFRQTTAQGGETEGNVLTWRELSRPTDADGFGVVSVVTIDVDAGGTFTAVGVVAEPGLVYASTNALYLTDTEFNFGGDRRETTDIYKFDLRSGRAEPVATGSVPGRILNQYSMGEFQDKLRVATTVSATFGPIGTRSGPFNNVYVLQETAGSLVTIGRVENIAPGETIQSARFLGNRGYLVTFRQIDPFFTLDLSDATNPRIVGELKVPGFSTFLQPMDENHILAVGEFISEDSPFTDRGVQLSIFDVTDFANPVQTANIVIGRNSGAFSEALFNPKAFTYFPERNLAALPISVFASSIFIDPPVIALVGDGDLVDGVAPVGDPDDSGVEAPPDSSDEASSPPPLPEGFDGLVVFSVSPDGGIEEMGRVSTRFEENGFFFSSFTRGVFIGDNVFAVTNNGVRGAPVDDLATAPYELIFEAQAPVFFGE